MLALLFFFFSCPLVSMQVTYTGTAMQTCKPCIIATFHKCCLLFQMFFSRNFQLQGNIQDTQLFYTLWSYHFSICCYFGPSLGHFPNIVYSYVSIIVTARLQAKPTQDKTMRGGKKKKNANQSKHCVENSQQFNCGKLCVVPKIA